MRGRWLGSLKLRRPDEGLRSITPARLWRRRRSASRTLDETRSSHECISKTAAVIRRQMRRLPEIARKRRHLPSEERERVIMFFKKRGAT